MAAEARLPPIDARDYWLAAALALVVAGFHYAQGQPLATSVLLKSFNWVFDFDSSRFLGGWCTPGADVARDLGLSFVARHALSITTRPLCLGLTQLVGDPGLALMALTALCAGLTAAIAYLFAAVFCSAWIDRLILATGFAISAQPLLLGVIPETFGFALAGIAFHFLLVARRLDTPATTSPLSVVSFAINAGVTVTNGVLNVVSSIVLAWHRLPWRRWLATEARTWFLGGLLLALLVIPLATVFAPAVLSESGSAPKAVWWVININRGEAAGLGQVLASFILYGFVAPELTVVNLPPPDSHPMLDFRALRYGPWGVAALAMWCAAMVASVALVWREDRSRRMLAIVAIWLLINIVLHWFWQYRGSVYLYGAHTAFPLFAVLVMGYAAALRHVDAAVVRAYAMVTVAISAMNNFGLYHAVIDFLASQPR